VNDYGKNYGRRADELGCDGMINKNKAPHVAAIIVTWNKKEFVTRLLEQLGTINYPPDKLSVTVVDNNSSDGTVDVIRSSFPWVRLIQNPSNLGGTGGFNCGMKRVLEEKPESKYLWLLDNDVLVDRNALSSLVAVLEKHTDAAICGSRIMDVDNTEELIEVGAFIDHKIGIIRRNMPANENETVGDFDTIFEVDYVAACSLLARIDDVKQVGLWHDHFFIYWDDMEWGARFNSFGYKVLAANGSIVYHPSWAGRIADSSVIWRSYYRTRNSLWFYNNYLNGIRRRLTIILMITRFIAHAFAACLSVRSGVSQAFLEGIGDFFSGRYGKKEFQMPETDIQRYLEKEDKKNLCLFLSGLEVWGDVRRFMDNLKKTCSELSTVAVVPKTLESKYEKILGKSNIIGYTQLKNGSIPLTDKWKIICFIRKRPWEFLLTSSVVSRILVVWGRDVIRMNFEDERVMGIERMRFRELLVIPFFYLLFFLKVLFFLPKKDMTWIENLEKRTRRRFKPQFTKISSR
jgi:GT2 family glycosyltransferase